VIVAAFCFYNLSSIVNGLVYFNQFSLIPPLHLGLVILGIVVLLIGVWVVSIQSGDGGVDIGTWQKGHEDIALMEECDEPEELDEAGQLHSPMSPFGSASEPLLPTKRMSSPSQSPQPRIPRPSVCIPSVEVSMPTPIPSARPSYERQTTESIILSPESNSSPLRHRGTTRLRRESSLYRSISRVGNVSGTLGGGFQIGLSPVSPGFSIIPRERHGRRRVSSGFGTGTSVEEEESDQRITRRRALSEADATWRLPGLDRVGDEEEGHVGVSDEGRGIEVGRGKEKKKRWRWLRKVFRGDGR
jgi:magnesium transporter